MNAGLQCFANAPFVREFFIKNVSKDANYAPYEYSVNMDNPLAFDGDFAESFADAMESIWETKTGFYLSVWPRKFKKQLGVVKEQFQGY